VALPLKSDIFLRLVSSLSGMGLRRSHEGSVVSIVCRLIPRDHGIRGKQSGQIARDVSELQEWRRNSFPTWARSLRVFHWSPPGSEGNIRGNSREARFRLGEPPGLWSADIDNECPTAPEDFGQRGARLAVLLGMERGGV
jgi:hypothetical protein